MLWYVILAFPPSSALPESSKYFDYCLGLVIMFMREKAAASFFGASEMHMRVYLLKVLFQLDSVILLLLAYLVSRF